MRIVTLCVVIAFNLISQTVGSTGPTIQLPYYWSIEPVQHGFDGEHVKLAFCIKPGWRWIHDVSVTVLAKDGIAYSGPTIWQAAFPSMSDSNYVMLELKVPTNDTSEIEFVLTTKTPEDKVFNYSVPYCFVTQGDSIEYWKGDPRVPWAMRSAIGPKSGKLDRDTLKPSDLEVICDVAMSLRSPQAMAAAAKIIGHAPEVDKRGNARVRIPLRQLLALADAGINCEQLHRPDTASAEPDTTGANGTIVGPIRINENDAKRELMKRREQAPLNDKTTEGFFINGEMWQRNYGETKFRKVEPLTDVNAYLQRMNDSLNALPDDHLFDICLTLSETGELSKTKEVLGELPEPVDSVHYHLKLTKQQIAELADANIRLSYIMNGRCYHDSLGAADTSAADQKESPSAK